MDSGDQFLLMTRTNRRMELFFIDANSLQNIVPMRQFGGGTSCEQDVCSKVEMCAEWRSGGRRNGD